MSPPNTSRLYFDNAATSWPKPDAVYEAVDRAMREVGAPAGRGVYRQAMEADRIVTDARRLVAELVGARDPRSIIFTHNGTDSLNMALHGALHGGGHVVTTAAEHNSVLRPLHWLEDNRNVDVTHVACDTNGCFTADAVLDAVRDDTRLAAVIHASNVTGSIAPLETIAKGLADHPAMLLVDAAQSLGHLPIDVERLPVDLLAAPGHKGLLGPLGTGVLYVRPSAAAHLGTFRQGGTGTDSHSAAQPETLPEKFEAGNLNVPGLAGLAAGVRHLLDTGLSTIREHELQLAEALMRGLGVIEGIRLYGSDSSAERVGVVSFNVADTEPQDVAAMLDATHGIQVRAGLHCAPRIHEALGTLAFGGTVRLSTGPFNSLEQVEAAVSAVSDLAAATVVE